MRQCLLFLFLALLPASLLAQKTGGSTGGTTGPPPVVILPPPEPAYSSFEQLSTYQLRADSILAALDKTPISTGILYDRTAGTAYLDAFNRVHNDLDTSNVYHFLQAYYELRAAKYNEAGTLPARQLLAENANARRHRDTISLGVLRYRFHTLDPRAVQDNLLRQDDSTNPPRLFDVAGRPRSPYLLQEAVVAAAMADSLPKSGTAYFHLDPGYLFTNTGATLTSARIDFADGSGIRTLTPDQVVQISYASTGWKTLRYILAYSDGSQFTTYSRLWVRVSFVACNNCSTLAEVGVAPCFTNTVDSDIAHPAGASVPLIGQRGRAAISYYYSTVPLKPCQQGPFNVTKPVIVIDGIDHAQERNGQTLFNQYLYYRENNQDKNLGVELRDAGYDVVIMDHPNITRRWRIGAGSYEQILRHGGSDYMERNAYALVKLIQTLNQ